MGQTKHASIRAQQRGIPPLVDRWLDEFGEEEHDGHGYVRLYFSHRSVREMERALGHQPVCLSAVFRLVVAFILVCQAAFRKLCCSVGFGVLGLRWTSLIGLQLRAAPDHRLGFAWRAAA